MALEVEVKRVLNRHRSRDSWFLDDYSVNPYTDCQFGCVYCYIHGSRYGAGIRGLAVKVNAPEVLDRELSCRASRGQYGFVAFSSSTEPWMPLEAHYRVSRRCLEALLRHRFPVHCLTKSKLILRDLDLLLRLDGEAVLPQDLNWVGRGVLVTVSLSTLREDLASIFEPGAPKPEERLELVGRLRDRGLKAGVAYIPVLPYLSDGELEEMVRAAVEVDASYVFFGSSPSTAGSLEALSGDSSGFWSITSRSSYRSIGGSIEAGLPLVDMRLGWMLRRGGYVDAMG